MINAKDIIKFNRTDEELEELALFLIAVAGKKADTVAKQLHTFLSIYDDKGRMTPFAVVKYRLTSQAMSLEQQLKLHGFGCQTRLARAFKETTESGLNLRTCSLEDLMKIHGIGRKSASCFLAWTRPKVQVAMLDTHLMKYIRNEMGYSDAPKATPSSKKQYDYYEKLYLDHCKEKKVNPTEYDLQIWKSYAYKN